MIGIALAMSLLVACIRSGTTTCADGTICRDGTVCAPAGDRTLCVTPEQLEACEGRAEFEDCGGDRCYAIDDGLVCLPFTCGNGFADPEEQCDDGNNASGDGCSADCASNETCGNRVIDPLDGERCDDGNNVSHDGCSSRCDIEVARWTVNALSVFTPGARSETAMAFDARRGTLVVFGGNQAGPGSTQDYPATVSEWDRTWIDINTPTAPAGRNSPAFAYDDERGVVVMFGGSMDNAPLADTWEWTGTEWRAVDSIGPISRKSSALAYDAIGHRTILFGGEGKDIYRDTWILERGEWTELVPLTAPPASSTPTMTFDPIAGVIVLVSNGEQWELSGSTWTQVGNVPGRPDAQKWIVFDVGLGKRLLLGPDNGTSLKTWAWDGQAWTELVRTAVPVSSVRNIVADRVHGGVIALLITGVGIWSTSGTFEEVPTGTFADPATRRGAAAANDLRRRNVIYFGGNNNDRNTPQRVGDTVAYDGRVWRILSPTGTPSPRWEHAMAYDIARDRVVLFGGDTATGLSGETWLWDGSTWTKATPSMSPSPRIGHSMTYDRERDLVVLFGGFDGSGSVRSDTWLWNGTTWALQATPGSGPSPRLGAALAYDPNGGGVILFGGGVNATMSEGYPDTWRLDASGWTQLSPVIDPSPRMRGQLTWSPARRRLIRWREPGRRWNHRAPGPRPRCMGMGWPAMARASNGTARRHRARRVRDAGWCEHRDDRWTHV